MSSSAVTVYQGYASNREYAVWESYPGELVVARHDQRHDDHDYQDSGDDDHSTSNLPRAAGDRGSEWARYATR